MHRPVKAVVVTAAIAAATATALSGCSSSPVANTAAQPASTSTPALPSATPAAPSATPAQASAGAAASGTSRTIQGPSEDMQWGPVQVSVTLKGKQIVDVQASYPTERQRSAFINQQAVPMLRQEVLQAQVAGLQNIYGISGATMTSEAYYQSLMAALQQVGL